jgi:phytanoyl-CoA hydroxylase
MIEQFLAPANPNKDLRKATDAAGVTHIDRVPVVVKAGGGACHGGWTWHGSDVNRSSNPRRSIVAHCMSSENRFHSTYVGYIYSRYKRFGDDTMDESFFPIPWRNDGYRSPFSAPFAARKITWGEAVAG